MATAANAVLLLGISSNELHSRCACVCLVEFNTFYVRFYNEISVEPVSVLHIMKNTILECVVLTE